MNITVCVIWCFPLSSASLNLLGVSLLSVTPCPKYRLSNVPYPSHILTHTLYVWPYTYIRSGVPPLQQQFEPARCQFTVCHPLSQPSTVVLVQPPIQHHLHHTCTEITLYFNKSLSQKVTKAPTRSVDTRAVTFEQNMYHWILALIHN